MEPRGLGRDSNGLKEFRELIGG